MVVVAGALLVTACGGGSDNGSDDAGGGPSSSGMDEMRTVEVDMVDNEFSPDRIEVSAGETVRFRFTNEGDVVHDAVVGDEAAQEAHEEEMRASESTGGNTGTDGMAHGTDDEGEGAAITVEPGGTGELTYTFEAGANLLIGCHEPGHYDAGMQIAIDLA